MPLGVGAGAGVGVGVRVPVDPRKRAKAAEERPNASEREDNDERATEPEGHVVMVDPKETFAQIGPASPRDDMQVKGCEVDHIGPRPRLLLRQMVAVLHYGALGRKAWAVALRPSVSNAEEAEHGRTLDSLGGCGQASSVSNRIGAMSTNAELRHTVCLAMQFSLPPGTAAYSGSGAGGGGAKCKAPWCVPVLAPGGTHPNAPTCGVFRSMRGTHTHTTLRQEPYDAQPLWTRLLGSGCRCAVAATDSEGWRPGGDTPQCGVFPPMCWAIISSSPDCGSPGGFGPRPLNWSAHVLISISDFWARSAQVAPDRGRPS